MWSMHTARAKDEHLHIPFGGHPQDCLGGVPEAQGAVDIRE